MTIDTSKKHRLRGYPESEVRGLWLDEHGVLRGFYRMSPRCQWKAMERGSDGRWLYGRPALDERDLIPVPDTVKSMGFWLAVRPNVHGVKCMDRSTAERTANVGEHADPDEPQGWIEYFPPHEYEAGSIIDPREDEEKA